MSRRRSSWYGPVRWLTVAAALAVVAAHPVAAEDAAPQALFDDCDGPRCLGVNVSDDLLERMNSEDGASLDELIDGLQLRYAGDEALDVRLIAARYQNGRLVRYGVSARTTLDESGDEHSVRESDRALREALRPVTERDLLVRNRADDADDRSFRASTGVFIGSLPPTYLVSGDAAGLVAGMQDGNGTAATLYGGAVGVVVLVPENADLRGEDNVTSIALMVDLEPVPR